MQASPYRYIDIEPKRDRMLGRGVDLLRETSGNRRRDFSVRLTGDGLDDGPRSARFHNRRSANSRTARLRAREPAAFAPGAELGPGTEGMRREPDLCSH
jgi:hypothetical protein